MAEDDEIDEAEEEITVRSAVTVAIGKMSIKLKDGEFKMTIGEFTRLVEFDKELSADDVGHIKVTWVDPTNETEYLPEI